MKGVIFTSFVDMVEEKFGVEVIDEIIQESNLESEGVFSAVGTYPFSDMVKLLTGLSNKVDLPAPALLNAFGHYLFGKLIERYPYVVSNLNNSFDLLAAIDNHIHVEVQKLYPTADLPDFTIENHSENEMILLYESPRKLSDLAEGLIEATLFHFKEDVSIQKEFINQDGSKVRFIMSRN